MELLNSIDLKKEETQYLLSLVLARYHQIKTNEQDIDDDIINGSIKNELHIIMSLYNKIESVHRVLEDE